jgi:hypothetical protein
MCGACNASYYNFFLPFKKPLAKKIVMKMSKVLGTMCKIIGILKIIPQHKNGCLQRGANGKNVNLVLMR